jgi:aspartate racemase
MNLKRIGILGGISYESTLNYYRLILEQYYTIYKDYYYPEVVIFSLSFQKFTDFENSNTREYIGYIMEGIHALEGAGVDFIAMAANSPHAVFDTISKQARVPMVSIVEATLIKAFKNNMKTLLLLGIAFTMESSFYTDAAEPYGIRVLVPNSKERAEINTIIFDELVRGIIKEKSKTRLLNIIGSYNVDGVILGCTELPLIVTPKDCSIPLLDTVKIHVNAILHYAVAE